MADTATSSLARTLARITPQQLFSMLVVLAALIAIVSAAWMWGQSADYRVLYSNLSDRDGGAIIEALQQQNIPYKFAEGGGALLVPGNLVHETRLRLASQGLPKGGTVGFELMENQKFGTSQFLEQVNYQRALEGELSRSMQTLAAVQNARVHLAIPKPSVFVKEQQKPSASVVLSLYPGRTLDPGQVNAIVHLVSSSIPNMPSNSVTVLDQTGNLLSANRDSSVDGMDASQLKYVRDIEQDYIKRIEDILAPITGAANVRAQVTADVDFSLSEQTAETFRPNQPPSQAAIRSTQTVESNNGSSTPGGVPGALSNQPPVPATAPIVAQPAAPAAAAASVNNTHKEATTNYEVDRTIRHTKLPVGSIRRLSVAVVMNDRTIVDKNGKASTRPFTDSEKAQISTLVKGAMGFDSKRGDTLNLLNSSFNAEVAGAATETPWWKQGDVIALAKDILKYLLISGVLLFLLFGILRPAFRNLMTPAPVSQFEREAAEAAALATHRVDGAALYGAQQAANSYESNLQTAKQIAQQDPKIVATVVKEWVNAE
ncbi:MAG TPA: flagellar basal-body MS-ring/collar protein FliF [Gallionellaceae bacterium]|nr:flagellar basal-body MS-ring/collar protein FliF [Gallionellaceae bacterium]